MARHYRRPDLDSPYLWLTILVTLAWAAGVAAIMLLVAAVWLTWALIALPAAGIAKLTRNDDLAQRAIRSLRWKIAPGQSR
jgi:hypothetical protein